MLPLNRACNSWAITEYKNSGGTLLNTLKQIADVTLPTHWAEFRVLAFEASRDDVGPNEKRPESALALLLGDIHSAAPIVRIHSSARPAISSIPCDATATISCI